MVVLPRVGDVLVVLGIVLEKAAKVPVMGDSSSLEFNLRWADG